MSVGKTPKEIIAFMEKEKVEVVDLRFMDFPGIWQHFSVPARELSEEAFEKGLGFDGSSIRGWQAINESDMLVKPVADTCFVDPFLHAKTLVAICNIADPLTGEDYTRDPRNIARKAEAFVKGTGLADVPYFGPEAEFFIFDDIRYDQNEHEGYYHIDSGEGRWNTGRQENPNLGYKIRYKEGYFPVPPDGQPAGHPKRDDAHPGVHRRPHRGAAPRGRNRRPVRDRHALQQPGDHGRQPPEIQVRHQEHRQEARQGGDVHAQAAVRRQRERHARPLLTLEGR